MYFNPSGPPEFEDRLITQQHIATRFQVIFFVDVFAGNGFTDGHAVLCLNKRHVIDDEDARLPDLFQFLDGPFGAFEAVAPPVKGPGATEGTIPRAAAAKFDRGTRIQHADEILASFAQEMPGRQEAIEAGNELRWGPWPSRLTRPGT